METLSLALIGLFFFTRWLLVSRWALWRRLALISQGAMDPSPKKTRVFDPWRSDPKEPRWNQAQALLWARREKEGLRKERQTKDFSWRQALGAPRAFIGFERQALALFCLRSMALSAWGLLSLGVWGCLVSAEAIPMMALLDWLFGLLACAGVFELEETLGKKPLRQTRAWAWRLGA